MKPKKTPIQFQFAELSMVVMIGVLVYINVIITKVAAKYKVQAKQGKQNLVIVGGGTAGWLAANMLVLHFNLNDWNIVVVESPEINAIGVGEGSTVHLDDFFKDIGVSEEQWMPLCNATYKLGIRFVGWSTKPGYDNYFHPFPAILDQLTEPEFLKYCVTRRKQQPVNTQPDDYYINEVLAKSGKGPKANHNFPFSVSYGYHFDAGLLGKFLAGVAINKGVEHVSATVDDVNLSENGDIASLQLNIGQRIEGDFFIDCTGFSRLLINKALGGEVISFAENLFNNAAVTIPTPSAGDINAQTVATAMPYGWRWDIPLTSRTGNGYVYSSDYCSADQAETQLREALGMLDSDVAANHLKMTTGRMKNVMTKNCLAVGLSQAFIEPLEATSIATSYLTVRDFINKVVNDGRIDYSNVDDLNEATANLVEGTRDYIVAHYRISSRRDTDYWLDNVSNSNLSERLVKIMQLWFAGEDLAKALPEYGLNDYYPETSWCSLFAGYGIFQELDSEQQKKVKKQKTTADFLHRCAMNYKSHSECLKMLG